MPNMTGKPPLGSKLSLWGAYAGWHETTLSRVVGAGPDCACARGGGGGVGGLFFYALATGGQLGVELAMDRENGTFDREKAKNGLFFSFFLMAVRPSKIVW